MLLQNLDNRAIEIFSRPKLSVVEENSRNFPPLRAFQYFRAGVIVNEDGDLRVELARFNGLRDRLEIAPTPRRENP